MADAFVHILVEQGFEHFLSFWAVLVEDVALLDVLSPLLSCERFLAVSQMADEIEIIHFGHSLLLLEGLQVDSRFSHQVGNLGLTLCFVPTKDEIVEAGVGAKNVRAGIVRYAFCMEQLSV